MEQSQVLANILFRPIKNEHYPHLLLWKVMKYLLDSKGMGKKKIHRSRLEFFIRENKEGWKRCKPMEKHKSICEEMIDLSIDTKTSHRSAFRYCDNNIEHFVTAYVYAMKQKDKTMTDREVFCDQWDKGHFFKGQ